MGGGSVDDDGDDDDDDDDDDAAALQGSPGFGVPGLQGPKGENGERVSHKKTLFCDVWVCDVRLCMCVCVLA